MRPLLRILLVVVAATSALAFTAGIASSDTLTVESFTGTAVSDTSAWVSGGTGSVACLTAGDNTSQAPIPGCQNPAIDAAGSGTLRLTPALTGRAGFALFNQALTTAGGLDITFHQAQWGGSAADGISFFLVDGATNLTQPGSTGGNLGYSPGGIGNGVANGLVGIGIDSWGNFSSPQAAGSGCANAGPGQTPNRVVIRGPGNGTVGYCFLGTSGAVGTISGASRAASTHTVRVVFDPNTVANRMVTVYLDGTQVVQVPAPQELLDATTFKFGFGAATGDATDNHEVWNLTIESVNPVNPPDPGPTPEPIPVAPNFTG